MSRKNMTEREKFDALITDFLFFLEFSALEDSTAFLRGGGAIFFLSSIGEKIKETGLVNNDEIDLYMRILKEKKVVSP